MRNVARGCSVVYSQDAAEEFLRVNGMKQMIRAHAVQVRESGSGTYRRRTPLGEEHGNSKTASVVARR